MTSFMTFRRKRSRSLIDYRYGTLRSWNTQGQLAEQGPDTPSFSCILPRPVITIYRMGSRTTPTPRRPGLPRYGTMRSWNTQGTTCRARSGHSELLMYPSPTSHHYIQNGLQ